MPKHVILALALGVLGLQAAAPPDDWKSLLKDDALTEWLAAGGGDAFRARAGTLTVDGPGQIVYGAEGKPLDVRDFELRAEVLTRPGGRAGLAFHLTPGNARSSGGIEVRLDNSYSTAGPGQSLLKTGSLVWLRPVVKSVVPDGRWFALHVSVRGPRVQVRVDKQLVTDYLEPEQLEAGPRLIVEVGPAPRGRRKRQAEAVAASEIPDTIVDAAAPIPPTEPAVRAPE